MVKSSKMRKTVSIYSKRKETEKKNFTQRAGAKEQLLFRIMKTESMKLIFKTLENTIVTSDAIL